MTVQCIACKHLNLRRDARMSVAGFGACDLKPVGHFQSLTLPHDCRKFTPAQEAIVQKRLAWRAERDTKKTKGATPEKATP